MHATIIPVGHAGICCGSEVSQLEQTIDFVLPLAACLAPSGTMEAQEGGFHHL